MGDWGVKSQRKHQDPAPKHQRNPEIQTPDPKRLLNLISRRNYVAPGCASFILQKFMQSLATITSTKTYAETLELPLSYVQARKPVSQKSLAEDLADFREFGQATRRLVT